MWESRGMGTWRQVDVGTWGHGDMEYMDVGLQGHGDTWTWGHMEGFRLKRTLKTDHKDAHVDVGIEGHMDRETW